MAAETVKAPRADVRSIQKCQGARQFRAMHTATQNAPRGVSDLPERFERVRRGQRTPGRESVNEIDAVQLAVGGLPAPEWRGIVVGVN
jgi:hypothetical protein